MKKISKIGIIMCMIAMFTMLLAGCDLVKKDDNKKEINKEELSGYTEYVDSSGVKFSYPSDWKNLGTTSKPVFGETSTGTSVNYLSESIPKMYNLTSYMAAAVKNVKESMHIDTDIEEEEVKLNGRDAAILTYNGATLNINGGQITTNGSHANAVFAYGNGVINIGIDGSGCIIGCKIGEFLYILEIYKKPALGFVAGEDGADTSRKLVV